MSRSHYLHKHLTKKQKRSMVDKTALYASFIYPLTGTPQAASALGGSTEGISVISWIGFAFFSTIFLAYALVHRIKPMIITNALWVTVDVVIVYAVIASRMTI